MEPHLAELQPGRHREMSFSKWAKETGIQKQIDPMNDVIWDICKNAGALGLLSYWAKYARKYPERCVVTEAQA